MAQKLSSHPSRFHFGNKLHTNYKMSLGLEKINNYLLQGISAQKNPMFLYYVQNM